MSATPFSFEALGAVPFQSPAPAAFGMPAAVPAPPLGMPMGHDAMLAAVAEAQAEADQIREAARQEGLAMGLQEARAELAPALAALVAAGTEVRTSAQEDAVALERAAVDLALALAERIVAGAVAAQPERVVDAVRGALRGVVERRSITILVNPADMEIVADQLDELRAGLGGIESCEVQAERRVSRGGAIVRTADGDVDARIETKLERAREVVETALSAPSAA
jgi:flagellar assembly protein FliH